MGEELFLTAAALGSLLRLCRDRLHGDLDLLLILGLTAETGGVAWLQAPIETEIAQQIGLATDDLRKKSAELVNQGLLLADGEISPTGRALLDEIAALLA